MSEERRVDVIGREEFYGALRELRDGVKEDMREHVGMKVGSIEKDIEAQKLTLYGKEGRNGVVGDITEMKSDAKWVKIIAAAIGAGAATVGHWIGISLEIGKK